MRQRTWKTAALILASSLALTACNDGDGAMPGMNHSTPSASAGAHNAADVEFATGMIPHHRQAVEMADLTAGKAQATAVKDLAAAIKAAQDPEIKQLSGWLTAWGEPVPTPGEHGGHDMSGSMPGMMSAEEMDALGKASGPAFDRMWVQLMIKHHRGAVTMAKTEQSVGQDPASIALAKKIETDQNREIATMQQLLEQLP
ncbi:DUF305 domain-containing protein [Kribbella sp. NBC_01245]|uniref:DUF305 domain-containing protein n=1 Tax=Kribbella sp. NBC_01245 TaxID=2903578 RepID=UPI002E2E4E09|nr:DUF305 domain-containing protein [Kribbella sp. NBC_01245]